MSLSADEFDYPLDEHLIAQHPLAQRDRSRLMVLRRSDGTTDHRSIADLPQLLDQGDLLVLNDTRVIPAKFACRRATGARIEGLFLREPDTGTWEVLLKNASRCRPDEALDLEGAAAVRLLLREDLGRGRWRVQPDPTAPAGQILEAAGRTPLPPYIRRDPQAVDRPDRERYQTVYAARPGAVAAPTAGLHLTRPLLAELAATGVDAVHVTLHVGLGTFAPVKTRDLADHPMHAEWYELTAGAADTLNAARREGRRIVAVGTTAVRVLETVAAADAAEPFAPAAGWTDLFLYPPAEFHATDALITNFHLPRSTLLMLVAAFCRPADAGGVRVILDAYAEAARLHYRFYSYGDAMLIE